MRDREREIEKEGYQCKDTCSYTSATRSYNRLFQRYACRRIWD